MCLATVYRHYEKAQPDLPDNDAICHHDNDAAAADDDDDDRIYFRQCRVQSTFVVSICYIRIH